MNECYELDVLEETEDISEETESIEDSTVEEIDKNYIIYIEGMQYGSVTRKTKDYSEALSIYRDMKQKFNIFKCHIVLDKQIIYSDGTNTITNIYKKSIGEDYDIQSKFKQILDIIHEIDNMRKMYMNTNSDADKYLSAFTHIIEESNIEDLSNTEIREMFKGVEEKASLRRISKMQVDYIQNIHYNINSIRHNAYKCIESCKKLDYLNNTEKAKQNSKIKSEEYKRTLGLK